ncbi:hypothetical protein ABEB36_000647 [Hypothenemus hampei]|uniref:Odorant receptor n=1 Tax=Hypothenemus hampei TaxID=57062 RepID=A0ABD1FEK9_HYPHA
MILFNRSGTNGSAIAVLELWPLKFSMQRFIQVNLENLFYTIEISTLILSKAAKIYFNLTEISKDIFIPNIYIMAEEIRKIVNSVSLKLELFVLLTGTSFTITALFNIYDLLFNEDRFWLEAVLVKDSIPFHIVRIVLFCGCIPAVVPLVTLPLCFLFFLFHAHINVLQLVDKIKKFDEQTSEGTLNDESVIENLKILSQFHLNIKGFHYEAFEVTQLYSTIFCLGGLLMGLVPWIAMFTYNAPKAPSLMLLSNYIWFMYALCDVIQEYQKTQEHLSYVLYDLKWYLWDAKCQKCYLLVMGQFSKELKIPVMFVFYGDLEVFKKATRLTYTVANCLFTLGRKSH